MSDFKGQVTLSKGKYSKLLEELHKKVEDDQLIILFTTILKDVLKFDPEKSTYNEVKEKLNKMKEEEGISTYQALNHKKYYEKNKEVLNRKRAELYRKTKLLKENLSNNIID